LSAGPEVLTSVFTAAIRQLPSHDVRSIRKVVSKLARQFHDEEPRTIVAAAMQMTAIGWRWPGYELVYWHEAARKSLGLREVEALGAGMASWVDTDVFGIYVAGPAWRQGGVSDADIRRWARSLDRWRRRAAVVATVALNIKSRGGTGDTARTLDIADLVVADRDDMVVKALSWALRSLVPWDPDGVRAFLDRHGPAIAARVRREVTHKLETGLKNPRR
jgi:hypothetical protein